MYKTADSMQTVDRDTYISWCPFDNKILLMRNRNIKRRVTTQVVTNRVVAIEVDQKAKPKFTPACEKNPAACPVNWMRRRMDMTVKCGMNV